MAYQPKRRNGQDIGAADRDCAKRYEAIKAVLLPYAGRELTVLDFGAYTGYFSQRLAEDFPSFTITAVDDHRGLKTSLRDTGVSVVNKRLSTDEVDALGRFDVVLCLSVLHHVPDWQATLDVLTRNGGTLFIESPRATEVLPKAVSHGRELTSAVNDLGGKVLVQTHGYGSKRQRQLKVIGALAEVETEEE